jgi:hypothetical protein
MNVTNEMNPRIGVRTVRVNLYESESEEEANDVTRRNEVIRIRKTIVVKR